MKNINAHTRCSISRSNVQCPDNPNDINFIESDRHYLIKSQHVHDPKVQSHLETALSLHLMIFHHSTLEIWLMIEACQVHWRLKPKLLGAPVNSASLCHFGGYNTMREINPFRIGRSTRTLLHLEGRTTHPSGRWDRRDPYSSSSRTSTSQDNSGSP